jgi:hypothetical protein
MNDKTGRGVAEAEEITEYGVQRTEERQVQRCKSADGRWKSGKVRGREDYRVRRTVSYEDRVKVQMGAELRCKGGKVNDKTGRGVAEAEEITEYRVQSTEERQVQRCKSEQSSCAKVQRWRRGRLQSTEFRVRSTELEGMR